MPGCIEHPAAPANRPPASWPGIAARGGFRAAPRVVHAVPTCPARAEPRTPMPRLAIEPLTASAFAPFGDLITPESAAKRYPINQGSSMRYHDLARVDTDSEGGRTLVSIFRAEPRTLPFTVRMLERHPLGSQAFVPLDPATQYLVVVAESEHTAPRAFLLKGGVGVNFARGVWHHPLIALDRTSDFLVIDRGGPGTNCDEIELDLTWTLDLATAG